MLESGGGIEQYNTVYQCCPDAGKIPEKKKRCIYPKIWTMWFHHNVMHPKDADRMANSVDTDQTAPSQTAQSDLHLHCLPRPVCLKTSDQ